MSMDRRFRKFALLVEWVNRRPDLVAKFMEGMVITKAECSYADADITYEAWHPDFLELTPGHPMPCLDVELMVETKAHPKTGVLTDGVVTGLRFVDPAPPVPLGVVGSEETKH